MAPPKLPLLNPTNTTEPQLPRYIVDYLKALDQWAQRIDSQVVRYGVNPPAGGEEIFGQVLRTTRILPPKIQSGIPYMEIDTTGTPQGNQTGLSPMIHVNDGTRDRVQIGQTSSGNYGAKLVDSTGNVIMDLSSTGKATVSDGTRVRAEWGNLAANGVSPAQYGFRANDANGNPIFDSLGLISVMSRIGYGDMTTNAPIINGNGTTWYDISMSTACTFTVTRKLTLLYLGYISANTTGASGAFSYAHLINAGGASSWAGLWDVKNGYTGFTFWALDSPNPGTWTIKCQVNPDSGQGFSVQSGHIDVFQLGT